MFQAERSIRSNKKIGSQAMRNVTGLIDLRLTGSIKDNYSNAKELNVAGQYTVRNAAVLNSAQTMAAGVDSTYNDAIYLPAQIAIVGSNSVVSARTNGNQVVGVFISLRTFGDMTSHWSKTAVAELAAKKISSIAAMELRLSLISRSPAPSSQ
ncbi:hypothetical protein ACFTAO_43740 [Paenibacillus rhizoplanae]